MVDAAIPDPSGQDLAERMNLLESAEQRAHQEVLDDELAASVGSTRDW